MLPASRNNKPGRRAKRRLLSITLLCLLGGCLSATREQLEQCTKAASATYPENKSMPLGQPFKDILACMQEAGYTVDGEGQCKYMDYAASVADARCYRPIGAISGYFHDVATVLH